MLSLNVVDINDGFHKVIDLFAGKGFNFAKGPSRNGTVKYCDTPLGITFNQPLQTRVLLRSDRDYNPFFHVAEALWMFVGSNSVFVPNYYCSNMKSFSDDGETLNGAYGYRWRNQKVRGQTVDQLAYLVRHLTENPSSRRAVLQMWNIENDLMHIDGPTMSLDVCCNTAVYFSKSRGNKLNMTVTNRSNDMIWGLFGSNYIHFTVLQEIMSACLGVEVGTYTQITNNAHVYLDKYPEATLTKWLESPELLYSIEEQDILGLSRNAYVPIFEPSLFSVTPEKPTLEQLTVAARLLLDIGVQHQSSTSTVESLEAKFEYHKKFIESEIDKRFRFFREVVFPMLSAFKIWKRVLPETTIEEIEELHCLAIKIMESCEDWAWRSIGTKWLSVRFNRRKEKACDRK